MSQAQVAQVNMGIEQEQHQWLEQLRQQQRHTIGGIVSLAAGAAACLALLAMFLVGPDKTRILSLAGGSFLAAAVAAALAARAFCNPRARPAAPVWGMTLAAIALVAVLPATLLALWLNPA